MNNLVAAFLLFFFAQGVIWFQTNGQFIWPWFKEHPVIVAFTLGGFAALMFLTATRYVVDHFNGLFWPGRFIAFATGMLIFAVLTYLFRGEGMNAKTIVSLILSLCIICLQIFWK
jgi:hypothetical protein